MSLMVAETVKGHSDGWSSVLRIPADPERSGSEAKQQAAA